MDPLARLGARLGAALKGAGTEADRLLLLTTTTDVMALLASGAAAFGILHLLQRRRDLDFRPILLATAAAFLAAATARGVSLWALAEPNRWLAGWWTLAAAAAALGAATYFWMQLPDVVRLQSGRQLRRANVGLTRENWDLQQKIQREHEALQLLSAALARATNAMAIISPTGQWLHANEALATLLGTSAARLSHQEPRLLFGDTLLDAKEELSEKRDVLLDGKRCILRATVKPLHDAAGQPQALLLQCSSAEEDDTETRRRLESELAEQTRLAAEAVALLQHALAEKEKSEAEFSRRAEQLERSAARLERLGTRVTELAGVDPATGLISAQALAGRLDLSMALARRFGRRFAVLVVAADTVDDLNPGDAPLLAALGGVLRAELRDTDAAARCDQERFCVLLAEAGSAEAARVAERVRRRLAATPLAIPDGRTLRLTCSVGTAEWKPNQGIGEMLGQAAEALRSDRAGGRNAARR